MAVVAEFNQASTGRAISDGLRHAGVPVTEIQAEAHHFHYTSKLLRAVGLLVHPLSKLSLEEEIVRQVKMAGVNVVLIVKGALIRPKLIHHLRSEGVYTVVYYPDFHFEHRGVDLGVLEGADLVCTTKSFQIDYLQKLRGVKPTVLVHHGFSPSIHAPTLPPLSEEEHEFDIFYAGTASAYKASILDAVVERFADRRILIAGAGWEVYRGSTRLGPFLHGGPIFGTFLSKFHECSRINLAMHFGVQGRQGWADKVSTRTFEIPASRGFMLHPDNEDLRSLFDVERELGVFSDVKSMLDAIAYYLANPCQRISMRDAGHARARAHHSYYVRATEILEHVRREVKDGEHV
ncbi:MAG: glycosyltransferase [Polynucleobacter sp.]|nr:glycosyltransferase [Polynucleobacter sp.]